MIRIVFDWVEQAAAASQAKCRIAVSVYAGLVRQGIANGQPALELAQKVASSKHAKLEGYMAYSGGASHTKGSKARSKKSAEDLSGLQETLRAFPEGRSAGEHRDRRFHRHLQYR